MNIEAFVVRVTCETCHGARKVPEKYVPEIMRTCPACRGVGSKEARMEMGDFKELIRETINPDHYGEHED
jgi:DnaJ-class molecular chaperone